MQWAPRTSPTNLTILYRLVLAVAYFVHSHRDRPSNFDLIVGAIILDILKPGELAENTLPTRYQYVVIDGRTVLIDPKTRKVVHITER